MITGRTIEFEFPVPVKTIPADESASPHQNREQRNVELLAMELTEKCSRKLGLSRREFPSTGCGMAVSFMAMNFVFGKFFAVDPAEAADLAIAQERKQALAGQFIFDVQTHFFSPGYTEKRMLDF